MATLASRSNIWETGLQVMQRRGYRLELAFSDDEDELPEEWTASKDGYTFYADNPIELLGLVAIFEEVQPEEDRAYWWSAKDVRQSPSLREQIRDEATAAADARMAALAALRQVDPQAWEAKVRAAFENGGPGDIVNAAGSLRIPRKELRRILVDPRLAGLSGLEGKCPEGKCPEGKCP